MGIKRWLWKATGIGTTVEVVKNIYNEGGIIKGYKKTIEDEFYEDNPITAPIYKQGKFDGKKDGYEKASDEYEKKLLKLADDFLEQKNILNDKFKEYEELLDAYEDKIQELENKENRTQNENDYLKALLLKERELKNMVK